MMHFRDFKIEDDLFRVKNKEVKIKTFFVSIAHISEI